MRYNLLMVRSREKSLARNKRYYDSHKEQAHQYYLANRQRIKAYYEEHKPPRIHPGWYQKYDLETRHGMTVEEYNLLIEKQEGKCAICHALPDKRRLVVSHDHDTGNARALLCYRCNKVLGLIHNNFVIAQSIAEYLGSHNFVKS